MGSCCSAPGSVHQSHGIQEGASSWLFTCWQPGTANAFTLQTPLTCISLTAQFSLVCADSCTEGFFYSYKTADQGIFPVDRGLMIPLLSQSPSKFGRSFFSSFTRVLVFSWTAHENVLLILVCPLDVCLP